MKKKHLINLLLAFVLLFPAFAVGVFFQFVVNISPAWADTSQNVSVNATPAYVSISNTPNSWALNGLTGGGAIDTNTTYYANPNDDTVAPSSTVQAGECLFDLTDSSTVNIDLAVNISDFSGGDANMLNSDDGSNDATHYGGYSWYAGQTYSNKVTMKTSASSALKSGHSGSLDWGAEILTQTGAWGGSSMSQATMTISASAS